MIYSYQGHYQFGKSAVAAYAPEATGVYYCGSLNVRGELVPLYIGKSVGIRSRLLQHLASNGWLGVAYFGFRQCTTEREAEALEAQEIKTYNPKYNEVGKVLRYR